MGKYAILLSGGIDKSRNYKRYRNDLEFAYKVLVEDCGYAAENIQIFFADGKALRYKDTDICTVEAVRENILQAFERMIEELRSEDSFTLIVSNHGGEDENGCIYLWGNDYLSLELLVYMLNKIKARKNIIFGQCFGGNILDMNVGNACIVTANDRGLESAGCLKPFQYDYDEFLLHFLSYIHGKYPDGIKIVGGNNDILKAYEYAVKNDIFSPDNPHMCKCGYEETPQIKCGLNGRVTL